VPVTFSAERERLRFGLTNSVTLKEKR